MKIPCSVGILTFNSADTLERALQSVQACDDIVVCDGGSRDQTLSIAQRYGCHIIQQDARYQDEQGKLIDYGGVRNQCLDAAKHDWFLYIDSDEAASAELVEEMRTVTSNATEPAVYAIQPRIIYDGVLVEYSSNYPGWQTRFFNRATGARFIKVVHERIDYDHIHVPTKHLAGHWYYYIDSHETFEALRRYAYMDASAAARRGARTLPRVFVRRVTNIAKILVKTIWFRVRHPQAQHMAFQYEVQRMRYQWVVFVRVVALCLGFVR